jgi:DNA primase catalytic subunit
LRAFYKHFFPLVAPQVIDVLGTCHGKFDLRQREIVPVLPGGIHVRNQTFATGEAFAEYALDNTPASIHFGPIFTGSDYSDHTVERSIYFNTGLAACYGEFVIDIDLDEKYDRSGVCECGTQKKVCVDCWRTFMDPCQLIMDYILRDFLGFKCFFACFSGRRGIHYWVLDERAVMMTRTQREQLIQSISLEFLIPGEPLYEDIKELVEPFCTSTGLSVEQLYPKFDKEVSRGDHLHKIPLGLHAETKCLCVILGDVTNEEERFVPIPASTGGDLYSVHYIAQNEAVMIGCAQKLAKIKKTWKV